MTYESRPFVVWLTGLSGAGKSTIAGVIERRLREEGVLVYNLDGDLLRTGLNRDLGYSDADRVENIRRVGEVARLMVSAGVSVIVSAISPFREGRQAARDLLEPGLFVEVHVDAALEEVEGRDVKGLYRRARNGEIPHFTGIDSPYEAPLAPEVRIASFTSPPAEEGEQVLAVLRTMGLL
ncbi:MAG: adenylyl-sulfate kinase [Acidimicrobiales bacterium]